MAVRYGVLSSVRTRYKVQKIFVGPGCRCELTNKFQGCHWDGFEFIRGVIGLTLFFIIFFVFFGF